MTTAKPISAQPKNILEISQYLSNFIEGFDLSEVDAEYPEVTVKQMSLDSRAIQSNDLFIALQGEKSHGLDFLESVFLKLPGLVISDRVLTEQEQILLDAHNQSHNQKVRLWVVADIQSQLGNFAAWFYDRPSQKLKVVGITGTNGKTSTAFFTGQLLKNLGHKVALIGTLGNGEIDNLQQSANTTPNSVQVQRLLNAFVEQGMDWVVMEVSSHALCLGRIQGVTFQTVALTQVTRDHIDFHGTEEAYSEAKSRLFTEYETQSSVLNVADALGNKLCHEKLQKNNSETVWCYSSEQLKKTLSADYKILPDLRCDNVQLTQQGIKFTPVFHNKRLADNLEIINLALMGLFNLENVLCAMSILLVNGFSWQVIKSKLPLLQSVAGRMQVLGKSPTIILDFAHTPDALEQVLTAVRSHLIDGNGALKVVFGCGGNRDQGKRPLMGAIAQSLADKVILTSDNPRDEAPAKIIKEIAAGINQSDSVQSMVDRKEAISQVLDHAKEQDIIVIAGKGHEDYQEISGVKHPFSDAEVVQDWLLTKESKKHG
ncbi:UDP-N-acetylmuramoyl-L-alanyl-D-glutamate--2,6-diaminopimelate ligase [Thiomicrorhabdus lithotrophica]|uniref:UDP-N-acetylmuramoyl-L-alanyl-D-glutamate--2,6-diaminopimelate ligase n=1 Tax=Thiomicrorhabdus lithotrophica TaxID=2949997 RepID=A0ABY8C7V5_9GAMM|nr:UDP-N-acetylmuramoyl-L-alanyl-D-glutamate--2,6-diaminopimelate ligase [Thiomicrorhabdus lithotrophica]WEJ62051.1 UDP-N-acetylmuramoyl-L-alanyl-D-glutamate--2,6-diaminopimelate ligase [Thiomicrorhabdus lithotrophica]